MYEWRKMEPEKRKKTLHHRNDKGFPAHELPHFSDGQPGIFFITGSNYLHLPIIGKSQDRMKNFTGSLISTIKQTGFDMYNYCVLPNHYHFLAYGSDVKILRTCLGKLHGSTSRQWNIEDQQIGRTVWYRVLDKIITSNRQFYSTINYIHYNPVKARLCGRITDWPWSSAFEFIEKVGKPKAIELWKRYPP